MTEKERERENHFLYECVCVYMKCDDERENKDYMVSYFEC